MIAGYKFLGSNRTNLSGKANRGSRGIGVLIKKSMYSCFSVKIGIKIDDNVLSVILTSNKNNECIVIYCVYLPPDMSRFGQNNENILNWLLLDIYNNQNVDATVICGDFNARIGNKKDTSEYDNIPERKHLDCVTNEQGNKLLNFINDMRGCHEWKDNTTPG